MMRALHTLTFVLPLVALTGRVMASAAPCPPGALTVTARGSARTDDFAEGAKITFSAAGGTHYVAVLINGGDEYPITNQVTGGRVFAANGAGNYDWDLTIEGTTGQFANQCLPPGNWTVRVYLVEDADNNGLPDNGLGCFVDQPFTFFPPCPPPTAPAFTVDANFISCREGEGSLRLFDFEEDLMYCVDELGNGATFEWQGPTGEDYGDVDEIRNLIPGAYRVTVRDFYGCTFDWRRDFGSLDDVGMTCAGTSPTQPGNGLIEIEIFDGRPPYVLSYSGTGDDGQPIPSVSDVPIMNDNVAVIENLFSGIYEFTVTDHNGCTSTCTVPLCLLEPTCTPSDPVVVGGTGSVRLDMDGLSPWEVSVMGPIDTSLTVNQSGTDLMDLPPGFYSVDIRDRVGCLGSCSFQINEVNCTLSADPIAVSPACAGDSDGTIFLNVTGAVSPLTIDWDQDQFDGQAQLENLPDGAYSVRLVDGAGCSIGPFDFNLAAAALPEVDLMVSREIECNGADDGALVAVTGTIQEPATYTWSEPGLPMLPTVENLGAGIYTVTVTDANGCRSQATVELTEPPALELACSATDETVAGDSTGTVTIATVGNGNPLQLTGDLGNFTLSGNNDTTFTNLTAGTYEITLIDSDGCSVECTSIVNPGICLIDLTTTVLQPDCDNPAGTATANPTDGAPPYQYFWSNGETTQTVSDLSPRLYGVTIVDAGGCATNEAFTIEPFDFGPSLIALPITPSCEGECIQLTLILARENPFELEYRYTDRNDNSFSRTLPNLDAGTLSFCPADFGLEAFDGGRFRFDFLTDATGCREPVDLVVPVPVFAPSIGALNPTICATDTFTYRGEQFHAGRTSGSVILANSSRNGCDSLVNVSIDFYPPATGIYRETICSGDTLDFLGARLHAGNPTATILLPGASRNACDSTVTATVDFFPPPVAGSFFDVICFGDTLDFFGTRLHADNPVDTIVLPRASIDGCDSTVIARLDFFPQATGSFSDTICAGDTLSYFGEPFYAGRSSGSVRLVGAAATGCDSTVEVNIDFFPADTGLVNLLLCAEDTLNYAGIDFHLTNPSGTVTLPGIGTGGCDSTVNVNVAFRPVVVGRLDTMICPESSFLLGGREFSGVIDQPQRVVIEGGAAGGCDSLIDVTVGVLSRGTVRLFGDGTICPFSPLEFSLDNQGTGIARVVLSNNLVDTLVLQPGVNTFSRIVPAGIELDIVYTEDASTCGPAPMGTIPVMDNDIAVAINIESGDGRHAIDCAFEASGEVVASASGGLGPYTYAWNNGATTARLTGLAAGEYRVTATSARGCESTASVRLEEPELLTAVIDSLPPDCDRPLPLLVVDDTQGGTGPYLFDMGSGFRPLMTDTVEANFGPIVIRIQDANGCEVEQRFFFDTLPPAEMAISPVRPIIPFGEEVTLEIEENFGATRYTLEPEGLVSDAPNFTVSPAVSTTYSLTATDPSGCTLTDTVRVIVDRFVRIYAPNVFSPNRDGVNDRYRLYSHKSVRELANFAIYDRWGNQVYQDPGPIDPQSDDWGWDGNSQSGEPHEQGLHVYTVRITLEDGRTVDTAGEVLLIR